MNLSLLTLQNHELAVTKGRKKCESKTKKSAGYGQSLTLVNNEQDCHFLENLKNLEKSKDVA